MGGVVCLLFFIGYKPHPHLPFAFGFNLPAILARKIVSYQGVGGFTDVHFPAAFHAAGGVDGVAPNVVLEPFHANDTRHHGDWDYA